MPTVPLKVNSFETITNQTSKTATLVRVIIIDQRGIVNVFEIWAKTIGVSQIVSDYKIIIVKIITA